MALKSILRAYQGRPGVSAWVKCRGKWHTCGAPVGQGSALRAFGAALLTRAATVECG